MFAEWRLPLTVIYVVNNLSICILQSESMVVGMCIHIFARNEVVTIPLLMEQIWLRPEYGQLRIEEAYDVVLRNDGDNDVNELWALYPHDIGIVENGVVRPQAEIQTLEPKRSSAFNWYISEVEWKENSSQDRIVISVPSDPNRGGFANTSEEHECQRLFADSPEFPAEIARNTDNYEIAKWIGKSLIRFSLAAPLKPGDTGVLRVCVNPDSTRLSGAGAPEGVCTDSLDHPSSFTWELSVDSAFMLRMRTRAAFIEAIARSDDATAAKIENLRHVFKSCVRDQPSGSVVIQSHRIAIVVEGGLDVTERSRSETVQSVGVLPRVHDDGGRRILLWVTGSNANSDRDLISNVVRIKKHLAFAGRAVPYQELTQKLVAHERESAFGVLLSQMEQVGLVATDDGGQSYRWNGDLSDDDERTGINNLRLVYDRADSESADEDQRRLLLEFRNLHPFQIGYRADWSSFPPNRDSRLRMRRLRNICWNLILLGIGLAGLVVAIGSLMTR